MSDKKQTKSESSSIQRVPTGIPGFDELCSGGILRNRSYLLSGTAGAGRRLPTGTRGAVAEAPLPP